MMKKRLAILLLPVILFSCSVKNKGYEVKGKINGADTGWIYLQKREEGKWIRTDSCRLKEGSFLFKGKLELAEMRFLYLPTVSDFIPFFLENSNIEIKAHIDSFYNASVVGSTTDNLYREYLKQVEEFDLQMEEVYEQYKTAKAAGDQGLIKKYDSIYTAMDKEKSKMILAFVAKNPTSIVSPYLVVSNAWQYELEDLELVMGKIDSSLVRSSYVTWLKNRIEILKKVAIGQPAPDFTLNDTNGVAVSLSSFKGKIVLVDFWASWCSSCRVENPNVVANFNKYNKKGLEILGISLDREKESWTEAIIADKLAWNHISDLKGWDNEAGKLYGVMGIPANVLLDKDGIIIARNLYGDQLGKKLAEIFD